MKKIFLFLSIFLILGVVINSCISEKVTDIIKEPDPDPDPDPDPEVKDRYFRFIGYANFSEKINTYAHVDMNLNIPNIIWSNTYETAELDVGLFLKSADSGQDLLRNSPLTISSLGNTESANSAKVTTSEKNGVLYAYYPYQASVSGTILSYNLDRAQNQSVADSLMDAVLNKNMLMISEPTSSFVLDGGNAYMYFKNVFSILRFRVNISQEMQILQPIKNITLYIAHKDDLNNPKEYILAGSYTMDLSKAPGTSGYAGPVFSSRENKITAELSDSENLSMTSTKPSIWLVVNPVTLSADDRLVAIVGLDNYKIVSAHEINELKSNTVYDIHVVMKNSNTVTDYVTTYFSNEQASNSYVIPKAGVCQIPLKTKNGSDLTGKSVEWLWASKEGGNSNFEISELIDPSSIVYDASAKAVRFRIGTSLGKYTKGNVILALKDDSGEIVWTWHIWITNDLEDINCKDGRVFLDRNIGALSADMASSDVNNYGFIYQWGRKDPFFGGDGMTNETAANVLSLARNHTMINTAATWAADVAKWSVQLTPGDTDAATKYPMRFICNNNNSLSKDMPADWLSVSRPELWYRSDDKKTDYDPCPSGYKVPGREDMDLLYQAAQANNLNFWYFINKGNKYWEYKDGETYNVSLWPAAGMRQGRASSDGNSGGQLIYSGTASDKGRCFYWTNTPVYLSLPSLTGGSHRVYTSENNVMYEFEYGDNADAYPIRCVKE